LADSHPAKIRNSGDKAKLISSNDSSGFTYRGRFTEDSQVCGVDFEVSQKAYNALRWLIARQGWRSGSQAIVSWAVSGSDVPNVLKNTFVLFGDDEDEEPVVNTAQQFGFKLSKRIAGYSARLGETDEIVVMGLDSATPGRMAITFYRELTGSEFLKRIESWHRSCCWFQNFGKDTKFIGAPSPNDIAKAAYGKDVDDKLKRATISRLLPCIVDGMPLPKDLLNSCFHNAVRRSAFDVWEWEKILGITCALYKNYNKETEDHVMALDRTRKTRDYLYGRLLAVGDGIEGFALGLAGEKRPTNAARLMQRFADYPCSTWRTIELKLVPYKARLGARIKKYQEELDEIMNLFDPDEYTDEKMPLGGEFLLGFHCQRTVLIESKNKTEGE
nr:type I-C CRISPR-associated protein Cas8c/Csd1 [Verrucomicrobiota bacterium]